MLCSPAHQEGLGSGNPSFPVFLVQLLKPWQGGSCVLWKGLPRGVCTWEDSRLGPGAGQTVLSQSSAMCTAARSLSPDLPSFLWASSQCGRDHGLLLPGGPGGSGVGTQLWATTDRLPEGVLLWAPRPPCGCTLHSGGIRASLETAWSWESGRGHGPSGEPWLSTASFLRARIPGNGCDPQASPEAQNQ